MSEKRFKTMKEVDNYLEKQIQFDYLTRFDVYLEEDYIFDNKTKKRYSFKNIDVNLALWEVIRDLSEESASLDDENARLLSERIKDFEHFEECVNKAKELKEKNKQLKEEIRAYPINEEYTEEIMQQNQKLRIERNHLRKENEELISTKCTDCELINLQTRKIDSLEKKNEQLRKKLECCEYSHFLNELDAIHEKVDKGDLSDFSPLKEDNPLKEDLYYWQCKYFRRDYEHKRDMCTRCNIYGGLLNYCLKDKCDKMVKKDYEVTVAHFDDGVNIGWKKR